jgi:cobalt-zinc-cadmium efflux system membrane fusion protein
MKYTLFAFILLFLFSCESAEDNKLGEEEIPSDEISLSYDKVESAGIETGLLSEIPLSEKIYCKGRLTAKPNNRVKYSSPLEGFVKRIFIQNGKFVKKGALLLSLEHPDFIELQKDYLIAESNLKFLEKEYARQKTLFESKAGKRKEYEKISSEYENAKAEYAALKAHLRMLKFNTDKLNSDNIRSSVNLYAPISGNINEINIALGQHVGTEDVLFEIINNNDFFLELNVFERDVQRIHIGQKLSFNFSMSAGIDSMYVAEIVSVGNYIDPLSKTFTVHALPKKQIEGMRHGIFINAEIHMNDEKLLALPDEAIISEGEKSFIFIVEDDTRYIRTEVQTGIRSDDYTQILNPELKDKTIVLKGANYINAEGEEE